MPIRCVAGLGNPGPRYESTRHNIGFWIVDGLARGEEGGWRRTEDRLERTVSIGGKRVVLVKPLTYMNASGRAVRASLEQHRVDPEELLVVVDDTALPEGRLRFRSAGGAGGHRGLASVEGELGSASYARLRVGIGEADEGEDLADFVLQPLGAEERARLERVAARGVEAVRVAVGEGVEAAMNRFHPFPATESGTDPEEVR